MSDLLANLVASHSPVPSFPQTSSLNPLHHRIIYLYPELLHLYSHYPGPVVPVLRAYWWGSTGDRRSSFCSLYQNALPAASLFHCS